MQNTIKTYTKKDSDSLMVNTLFKSYGTITEKEACKIVAQQAKSEGAKVSKYIQKVLKKRK